ncbi:HPr family phosphocarrier protein [Arthrobacter wenxiniae]|jgi:phosphocarrier protein|uniref:Phosphocarrier protein HPr n=1 Tax=Arthrobacter wenxiniae TaxID=2713570 RepID=A0A7Y7IIL8_9MICC|nr:HPr family phosphocarrier protein [Arthrobacter wenxiniae]NVM95922.1 HPr family phosphocarrier protein [Arthrobacter wenxiniae]
MSERKATVASSSGLHARPAALFAEAAGNAGVEVTIAMDGAPAEDAMDASSILSLMTLGAEHGSTVVLRAEGDGADAALDKLVALLETDLDAV